ncbi:MAG TPA: DUF3662 and FHA domain-containing protein [Nocardioidaceae bacterium]|nr:DUF3662 and FHA domain-containing protein [Nocardioidaceae bacterium]
MGVLQRFEQRLEQLVTGTFARAFRSAVQPVELAAALQREIDNSAQILSRDRRLIPNSFSVELSPADHERLSGYGATLSDELISMLREYANEQHYVFTGVVSIDIGQGDDLTTGRFRVASRANAHVTPVQGQSMTETTVHRAPVILEVAGIKHPLEAPGVVIGRGTEADLRVSDPGVSRRHVEIRVTPAAESISVHVYDLGSTNGTRVDGRRVQQARLRDGSEVQIGNTTMVLRNPMDRSHGSERGDGV